MAKATTPKVAAPKAAKPKAAKVTVPNHVAAIRTIEAHMEADKDFAEAVRHNLYGMLFTAAKSRTVRRNKANISMIDLEAIVKEIAPNIMRIFENH